MTDLSLPTRRFHVEAQGGALVLRVRTFDRERLWHAALWGFRALVASLGAFSLSAPPPIAGRHDPPAVLMAFLLASLFLTMAGLMWELRFGAYTGLVHRMITRSLVLPTGAGEGAGYRDAEPVFRADGRTVRGPGVRLVVVRYRPRPAPEREHRNSFIVCLAVAGALFRLEAFRTEPEAQRLAEHLATLLGVAHDPAPLPEESPLPPDWRFQVAILLPIVLVTAAFVVGIMLTIHDPQGLGWPALTVAFPLVDWLVARLVMRPLARGEAEERAEAILRKAGCAG
jgi:hypothetical protein